MPNYHEAKYSFIFSPCLNCILKVITYIRWIAQSIISSDITAQYHLGSLKSVLTSFSGNQRWHQHVSSRLLPGGKFPLFHAQPHCILDQFLFSQIVEVEPFRSDISSCVGVSGVGWHLLCVGSFFAQLSDLTLERDGD